MGRGHYHPKRCKVCGRRASEGHHISQTGLCPDDAKIRVSENLDGLVTMSGEPAQNWRRAMAACVGASLLDGTPLVPQSDGHAS